MPPIATHTYTGISTKCGRQSTEGYTHDGRLIGRGARNQEPDGNKDTRHKIYTGSGRQRDVKPYVMCSVILYLLGMRSGCLHDLSAREPLPLLIYSEGTELQVKYPIW
jgi:hypothetical protein